MKNDINIELSQLTDSELLDVYNSIVDHIKFLDDSIIDLDSGEKNDAE